MLDEGRHGLETGSFVRFREVEGMTELNQLDAVQVKVINPTTFSICDTSAFQAYSKGGIIEEVKMPQTFNFV